MRRTSLEPSSEQSCAVDTLVSVSDHSFTSLTCQTLATAPSQDQSQSMFAARVLPSLADQETSFIVIRRDIAAAARSSGPFARWHTRIPKRMHSIHVRGAGKGQPDSRDTDAQRPPNHRHERYLTQRSGHGYGTDVDGASAKQ
eukprot:3341337-Pleurochrysis_carterae.AAC.3